MQNQNNCVWSCIIDITGAFPRIWTKDSGVHTNCLQKDWITTTSNHSTWTTHLKMAGHDFGRIWWNSKFIWSWSQIQVPQYHQTIWLVHDTIIRHKTVFSHQIKGCLCQIQGSRTLHSGHPTKPHRCCIIEGQTNDRTFRLLKHQPTGPIDWTTKLFLLQNQKWWTQNIFCKICARTWTIGQFLYQKQDQTTVLGEIQCENGRCLCNSKGW